MSLATIYMTAPDKATAEKIGRALLEERLVACINVYDNVSSTYWWEGRLESSSEAVMFAKTMMRYVDKAVTMIRELHPDDVPCVTAIPVLKSNPDYFAWIQETTAPKPEGSEA